MILRSHKGTGRDGLRSSTRPNCTSYKGQDDKDTFERFIIPPRPLLNHNAISNHVKKLGFIVKPSRFGGLGLFYKGKEPLPALTYLGHYTGKLIGKRGYTGSILSKRGRAFEPGDYSMEAKNGTILDAQNCGHPLIYIQDNFQVDPDYLDFKFVDDNKGIAVFTNKVFAPAATCPQEKFVSYGLQYWYPHNMQKLTDFDFEQLLGFEKYYGDKIKKTKEYEAILENAYTKQKELKNKQKQQLVLARKSRTKKYGQANRSIKNKLKNRQGNFLL